MKDNELVEKVAKKQLRAFTHKKVLEWASDRLIYMSNVLYTVQAEMDDIPKNESILSHLGIAQEGIRHAIHAAGYKPEEKIVDWRSVTVGLGNVSETDEDLVNCMKISATPIQEIKNLSRMLIDQKNRICDFVAVELKEHDKMSGRTDKMSGFVKEFFTELDKFEEELYYVIQSRA